MRNFIQFIVVLVGILFLSFAVAADKVVVIPIFKEPEARLVCPPMPPPAGDAMESDVLEGKTFSSMSGIGLNGSIPIRNGDNSSIGQSSEAGIHYFTVPEGYYDGDDRVSAQDSDIATLDTDIDPTNIRGGVTIFGVTGTMPPIACNYVDEYCDIASINPQVCSYDIEECCGGDCGLMSMDCSYGCTSCCTTVANCENLQAQCYSYNE